MPDDLARRLPAVSSSFRNLCVLVEDHAPRSAALLLGCRWSFALPAPALRAELTEYTLPSGPDRYPAAVARRTGLRILEHAGDEPADLAQHLAAGGAAVVAVDCFHLSHRPAFGRVHSTRTLLVRPGRTAGEVLVDDAWDPAYRGPVPWAELQRARFSDAPLDPVREPVFAGCPVGGAWLSVEYASTPVLDPAAWGRRVLAQLCAEATTGGSDARGEYGIDALLRLERECRQAGEDSAAGRFGWARQASLLLRAELSSRFFLRVLVRTVALWTADPALRRAAEDYDEALYALEKARDLLVKSLRRPELACLPWASHQLRRAWTAESRLAGQIQRATQACRFPPIETEGAAS